MLSACGIIAEYNPFHNGHLWQLQQVKKLTGLPVMIAMSGHFTQRGEAACLDKWTRAKAAVAAGADLVLELPLPCVLSSGEFFAAAGVELLASSGCLTALACGVEGASFDFPTLARLSLTPAYAASLRQGLAEGLGYAAACSRAFASHLPKNIPPLKKANDILALEYTKALLPLGITPIYLPRQEAAHEANEIAPGAYFASGRALRAAWGKNEWQKVASCVPRSILKIMQERTLPRADLFWHLAAYRLRTLSAREIAAVSACSEGLEERLKAAAASGDLDSALKFLSSKRYSTSRLRRLLCQIILAQRAELYKKPRPAYLRVLAFNDVGRSLLKVMKKRAALPIISKTSPSVLKRLGPTVEERFFAEAAATDLYGLLFSPSLPTGLEHTTSPCYLP